MRIISGKFGGRRLKAVPGMQTRPTTDKVKESMFSIIGPYFNGGKVLDLFAGSGGLSIEAVSRGSDEAYMVDRQYQAIKTIKENVQITKSETQFHLFKMDAQRALSKFALQNIRFDLVFLDPPYKQQKIVRNILKMDSLKLLNDNATIVCETDRDANLPQIINGFEFYKTVTYGITVLTIYHYVGD